MKLSPDVVKEFNQMYDHYIRDGNGKSIPYTSKTPKSLFLNYMIENKNILVHGSNNGEIDLFEPRKQSLANGKPVNAVFSASDGIWSLFFAVINRNDYIGSLRNICITIPAKQGMKRYYYFSVNKDFKGNCWTNGTIYFFDKNDFEQGGAKNEWICETNIKPLAKMPVNPEDFPFLRRVNKHSQKDSALKTLMKVIIFNKKM